MKRYLVQRMLQMHCRRPECKLQAFELADTKRVATPESPPLAFSLPDTMHATGVALLTSSTL